MLDRIASLLHIDPPGPDVEGFLLAFGTAIPTDATAGYAPGCIFIDYVGAAIYVNEGTLASCDFDLVSVA